MEIRETDYDSSGRLLSELLEQHSQSESPGVPPYESRKLCYSAFDGDRCVGGVTGDMAWRMLYVNLLAVDPAARGTGLGTRLLDTIERIAKEQGCIVSTLTTMSWQAPDFYRKCGYEVFGEIRDCPRPGDVKYFMRKTL